MVNGHLDDNAFRPSSCARANDEASRSEALKLGLLRS
jgi:hypothetical protein